MALRQSPIEGESLRGYLGRYAAGFGFAPGEVAAAFGLIGEHRFDGLRLSPAQAERAARVSGVAPETLRAMTLERHAGTAFSFSGAGGKSRLPRSVVAQEVSVFSSKACPTCLREQGTWLLRWQLGWSLLCTRHRVLLISACPACGRRLEPPRRARWPSDGRGELRDPCACRGRVGDRLCRADIRVVTAIDVAGDHRLVEAQRRIDAMLAGAYRPRIAGEEVAPLTYLRDLQAMALLLRKHQEFAAERPAALRREAARQADCRGRLLLNPAALAAVLPEAMRLADLPDEAALVEGLREVLERRHRADGATLPRLRELRAPSERLTGALLLARQTAGFAHVSTRMGIDPLAHRRPDDLDPRLEARHVPQLFWATDYEHSLQPLFDFDDFSPWFGRRFCSALLARMLEPLDWRGAVRRLELPGSYRHGGYQATLWKLRREGRAEELVARIKTAANRRAARGPLVDYQDRRALLADWKGIDPECWLYLQPVGRPERWRVDPPKRRAHASIWLWCELTSGHERAAPIPLPGRAGKDLNEHTNFRHRFLEPLRERLLILGELLLATPAGARQTLPTLLAAALHERGHLARTFRLDTLEPTIARRALAHVAAHTGVDLATLTTATGGQAPAAVTHARLLAAAVLRRSTLASWGPIATVLPGGQSRLASNDRAYQTKLDRDPSSAGELEELIGRVLDLATPAPEAPEVPHRRRMRTLAEAIKETAAELLPSADPIGRRAAGALACREHTDLTWSELGAVHDIPAYAAFFQATVTNRRRADPDFDRRYRRLLDSARTLRCSAGFANATLSRGLINNTKDASHAT
jgi:hypothetical protein